MNELKYDPSRKKLQLFSEYEYRKMIGTISGRRQIRKDGKFYCWEFPLDAYPVIEERLSENLSVDTSVKKALKDRQSYFDRFDNLKKQAAENLEPADLKLGLYEHQQILFNFGKRLKYFADFSEPGVGKTAVQIALIKERAVRTLIICPKTIIDLVWGGQSGDLKKFAPEIDYQILTGGSAKIKELLQTTNSQVYIINYESAWRVGDDLLAKDFEFVVVDESFRIANRTSKQSKFIQKLGKQSTYRSIMTGVPAPNGFLDLFGQFLFLDPEIFGTSYYVFRDKYFYPVDYNQYTWIPKPGAKEDIGEKMYLRAMRFEKKDCLDLPKMTTKPMTCPMAPKQRKAYEQMENVLIAQLQDGALFEAGNILTQLLRLNMIASGFIQNKEGEDITRFTKQPKLDMLMELVETLLPNKVIIWAVFRDNIQMIREVCVDKYGQEAVAVLQGGVTNKEQVVSRFKTDEACKIFIANPATIKYGANLTESRYNIYYSYDYSFDNYYQSVERINRTGQDYKMTTYVLQCEKSIDRMIWGALKQKGNINDFISQLRHEWR